MKNKNEIDTYLEYCRFQKRLNEKTIRAYRVDLNQFYSLVPENNISKVLTTTIEDYIRFLNSNYKPKTVKRKIASVKAFFYYLEYHDVITASPWRKIKTKFREPLSLPRTIPINSIQKLLLTIYDQMQFASTKYRQRNAIRDAAICELLFATGLRVFELCSLNAEDIDLYENTVWVHGKGAKERILQIGNQKVHDILIQYQRSYSNEIITCGRFFVNQHGTPFSDQSIRRMLRYYSSLASIEQHITPHMFRHTFATALLDADVDIRYIQEMLGHSSIHTTEIYTHVSLAKQKNILCNKHPRNYFNF